MIPPDTVLTRYLREDKFLSLIENGLFLSKVSKYTDDLEGILPYTNKSIDDSILNKTKIKGALEWVYASCWFEGKKESQKMWDTYAESPNDIAIRIRARNLVHLYLSKVQNMQSYFDSILYKNPSIETFKRHRSVTVLTNHLANEGYPSLIFTALFSFYKHTDFEYENEIRLVTVDSNAKEGKNNSENGFVINDIDLNNFIDEIILNPYASFDNRIHINSILKKYDIRKPVLSSSLRL